VRIVIHVDGPTIRGNERQVISIAAGLAGRGHQVVVSCRAGGPVAAELQRRGVRTTGVRPRGDLDLWSVVRFAAWLRSERPDAVLLTSWKRAFNGLAAARAARVPRVVLRIGAQQPLGSGLRGLEERHALRKWADAIVVNNRVMLRRLSESIPRLGRDRLHYVPNGLLTLPAGTGSIRADLGIAPEAVLVCAVGGLEPNKGFDLLMQALSRLPEHFHALLVGGGTDPQRRWLEGVAEDCGVSHRAHLLGPRRDVEALLAAADVFALSSRAEGMSVVMMEAMAAGVPVVAFDTGGAVDALGAWEERPPAGWLVPPEDAGALAATLEEVADDLRSGRICTPDRVEEARWRIRNWYGIESMLDGYERALSSGSARSGA
jgi:glycosyltransferase involved in cell wall biosynthesis